MNKSTEDTMFSIVIWKQDMLDTSQTLIDHLKFIGHDRESIEAIRRKLDSVKLIIEEVFDSLLTENIND